MSSDQLRGVAEAACFRQLIAALSEVYRPEGVLIWLGSPNRHLDGKSPRDLISNGSEDDWAALLNEGHRIAEGSGW